MSELSDNLQNATREALDAINELNVVVREKMERIDFLEQQLEAERAKAAKKDAALRNGILQIEYLEKKFNAGTGSGEQTKAQMVAALQVYDEGKL